MKSIKQITISFVLVSIIGFITTGLSSCSDSEAAGDTDTHVFLSETLTNHDLLMTGNQDTSLLKTVQRIEAQVGQSGQGGSGISQSVETMAALTSKLSDDIGLMADRIVETEKLIVAVIVNQTQAAQTVIANTKDRSGAPLVPGLDAVPVNEIPMVFNDILTSVKGGGVNSILLNIPANLTSVTATLAPEITYNALPINQYQLLISDDSRFPIGATIKNVIDTNANASLAQSLTTVWQDAVATLGGVPTLGQLTLFIAVQDIDVQNNNILSEISNNIKIIVNP